MCSPLCLSVAPRRVKVLVFGNNMYPGSLGAGDVLERTGDKTSTHLAPIRRSDRKSLTAPMNNEAESGGRRGKPLVIGTWSCR